MTKKRVVSLSTLIDIYIFISAVLVIFIHIDAAFFLGLSLILLSIYVLNKVKFNKHLLLLFSLIAYVNISISLSDLMMFASPLSENTLNWQSETRNSQYLVVGAKLLLLQMSTINLFLSSKFLNKLKKENVTYDLPMRNNPIIYWAGLVVLIIFWKFGYIDGVGDSYTSNTRTIYEYCIIIFIFVWTYSGNSRWKKYLLYAYSVIYIVQSLYRGDRSSAFPMLFLVILTILPKIKLNLNKIAIYGIFGILASNAVSVYRDSYSFQNFTTNYIEKYANSLMSSDTASMSYYTSITIIKVADLIGNGFIYFGDFVVGLFLGGGFGNANVNEFVLNFAMHKNGGLFYSWFYFWFGFIGVFLGSAILAIIIRKFYGNSGLYFEMSRIALLVMSFRWYLYTPFTLFRSVLIVFGGIYFLCKFADKLMKGSVNLVAAGDKYNGK